MNRGPAKYFGSAAIVPAVCAASGPLRLPLTILRNNPVTTIEIGGREVQIGVDTGGGKLGLTRETLTQAGAVELGADRAVWMDAEGRTHEARRYLVPEIRVGGRSFSNLEAIEAKPIPNGPAVANALGREFLRQFIVIVDYPGLMITLAAARNCGCRGSSIGMQRYPCAV